MLTASEAAAQLRVKLGTLYAYVSRGWLKSYRRKVGRQALYRRTDIEALRGVIAPERGVRARSLPDAASWVTVAQPPTDGSPTGVIVAESAVSSIIDGHLAYRGYPIEELVERASFEEVCLLLWSGERPRPEEVDHLRAGIASARIPPPVVAALAAVGTDAPPLLRLAVMMPSLAAAEHRLPARSRIDQARMIITVLPLGLASVAPHAGETPAWLTPGGGLPGMAARLCERSLAGDFAAADRELDCTSSGPCWLGHPQVAECVTETIRRGEEVRSLYGLVAYVVMPNHVHLLIDPRCPAPKITQFVKGVSAKQANELLRRTGQPFWQDESFDHWVRSAKEKNNIIRYIEFNPVRANLALEPRLFRYSGAFTG